MASSAPFTLRWGIMATGWIAEGEHISVLVRPRLWQELPPRLTRE